MIHVAICDDDPAILRLIGQYLKRYSVENGETVEIACYAEGSELLMGFRPDIDIVFLDICMQTIDGIAVARRIRETNEEVCLIFVTSMAQYALDGFSVHASGFLVKPISYTDFAAEMRIALRRVSSRSSGFFTARNADGIHRIAFSSILYVEVLNHSTLVMTPEKSNSFYIPLREVELQLSGQTFHRCHASYLVNFEHIRSIQQNSIILTNGQQIPVSKNRKKDFLLAFAKYAGNRV